MWIWAKAESICSNFFKSTSYYYNYDSRSKIKLGGKKSGLYATFRSTRHFLQHGLWTSQRVWKKRKRWVPLHPPMLSCHSLQLEWQPFTSCTFCLVTHFVTMNANNMLYIKITTGPEKQALLHNHPSDKNKPLLSTKT